MLSSVQQLLQPSESRVSGYGHCVVGVVIMLWVWFAGTRHVTMEDLEESCQDELAKTAKRLGFRRQDSDAARIYN